MQIVRIIEAPIKLQSNISNALVNFSEHTVSLLALVTDRKVNGRAAIGLAFNSIGRYAQSGIIRDRMAPRLLAADPGSLLQDGTDLLCPERVLACAMKNEKPGGHGDRAHSASAIELAVWDLNAKLAGEPASATIARHFNRPARDERVAVYAAGGYYYEGEAQSKLIQELQGYQTRGFDRFKIKIGGATLAQDLARIDAALTVVGSGSQLAVDANGRFDLDTALAYARALEPYNLLWYEEPGDPLDYGLHAALASEYGGVLATGENLFSHQDVRNLVRFGGARPDHDIFQMDPGLSYGVSEYARMLLELESDGFSRRQCYPHGGQLMGLHIVSGLNAGGTEVYPNVFQPLGGFADETRIADGFVQVPDSPGFGFEQKSNLIHEFTRLIA